MSVIGFNTSLLHGVDNKNPEGATHPPIYQSSAFKFDQAEDIEKVFTNKAMGYAYTRISNPTVDAFEQRVTYIVRRMHMAKVDYGTLKKGGFMRQKQKNNYCKTEVIRAVLVSSRELELFYTSWEEVLFSGIYK